ncbi:hypothetical protein [Algoriphagus sp. NG3]|uniref:hypothetical protein n=1 Tax=Algoriphagus sp. NG3 TaxID=3097546 RepID=UPI002A816FFB|nr:hypothetical protein [Algoriphagus sp. NG3]WPR76824.1 hypothetical protein SLW71_05660 [Algoriphagus sp. NG3]
MKIRYYLEYYHFGGTIKRINPSASMLASCQMLVNEYAKESLYVRVDLGDLPFDGATGNDRTLLFP